MFESVNRLQRAADLSRLLGDVILAIASDNRLAGNSDVSRLRRISERLTDYIDQTMRGERESDWFNLEALALRSELARISKSYTFRTEKSINTSSINLVNNGHVSTKDIIAQELEVAGVSDSEYSRYFLKIAHDILDQIDSISSYSSSNPYRSKIIRTIKPRPEHVQVVLGILNYFSKVAKQKGLSKDIKLKTENIDGDILFAIEFDPKDSQAMDQIFYEYGQVVTNKMLPGDFFDSGANALELKNKLEIAKLELRQTLEIVNLERSNTSSRISDLEKEVDWLRKTFEDSLLRSNDLSKIISDIAKDSSSAIRDHVGVILRRAENGLSESDKPLVIEHLTEIGKKDPELLSKVKSILDKSIVSATSTQLGQWITVVLRSIGG